MQLLVPLAAYWPKPDGFVLAYPEQEFEMAAVEGGLSVLKPPLGSMMAVEMEPTLRIRTLTGQWLVPLEFETAGQSEGQ